MGLGRHNSASTFRIEFISSDICGQKWKIQEHRFIGYISSRVKREMISGGKSQEGKSSELILPWFSKNKNNSDIVDFYFRFPFFSISKVSRLWEQSVRLSGTNEGWPLPVCSPWLRCPLLAHHFPPGFRVRVRDWSSLRKRIQNEKWLLEVANHICPDFD